MKHFFLLLVSIPSLLAACNDPAPASAELKKISVDQQLLDSIKKVSDSAYEKAYPASGFSEAEYMLNSKDSTVTQVMKDSSGNIRQVIIVKNKTRIYSAQYYPNGQLIASLAFDKFGQYHGASEEYHENGEVKEAGYYRNGLRTGLWKFFDSTGRFLDSTSYDQNGQPVHSVK